MEITTRDIALLLKDYLQSSNNYTLEAGIDSVTVSINKVSTTVKTDNKAIRNQTITQR
jgi:hypothetical protein